MTRRLATICLVAMLLIGVAAPSVRTQQASDNESLKGIRAISLGFTGLGTRLECQLQRKLKFPRVLCTRNHAKVSRAKNSAWKIEVRVIQCVENIEAEL